MQSVLDFQVTLPPLKVESRVSLELVKATAEFSVVIINILSSHKLVLMFPVNYEFTENMKT
jgi:hypothetical protein